MEIGELMWIQPDEMLDVPGTWAEIVEVTDFGYMVVPYDDPDEEPGPVDHEGNIINFG